MTTVLHERHVAGQRLGRHVEHDERSRAFGVAEQPAPLRSVQWRRLVPIFDQGNLGSCTGNAMAGALSTAPFTHHFTEPTARRIYSAATAVDGIAGVWPPEDTGSSGLAVCKVAKAKGWISRYDHAFSFNAALVALQAGSVITGISWYDSFDQPTNGVCTITPGAQIRGGHEVCVVGIDVDTQQVRFANSWADSWGDKGYGVWSWSTWEQLLADSGDVTVPIR